MEGVLLALLFSATFSMLFEAKYHKVENFLYGPPPKPLTEKGIPIMQYTTEMGWINCLKKMNIDTEIVFYGNSITALSDFQVYFPTKRICNLGIAGDDLDGLYRQVNMVQAVQPEKVFLLGGINGSLGISLDSFLVKYERIVFALKDSLPNSKIYLQSILPVSPRVYNIYTDNEKIKKMNNIIRKIGEKQNVEYIDLYSLYESDGVMPDSLTKDGIHLLTEHYDRWTKFIEPWINE